MLFVTEIVVLGEALAFHNRSFLYILTHQLRWEHTQQPAGTSGWKAQPQQRPKSLFTK